MLIFALALVGDSCWAQEVLRKWPCEIHLGLYFLRLCNCKLLTIQVVVSDDASHLAVERIVFLVGGSVMCTVGVRLRADALSLFSFDLPVRVKVEIECLLHLIRS